MNWAGGRVVVVAVDEVVAAVADSSSARTARLRLMGTASSSASVWSAQAVHSAAVRVIIRVCGGL
jgi:hypothetical protein